MPSPGAQLFSGESLQQERTKQREEQFRELDNTKEYCETHYYKIKHPSEFKNLVTTNPFWADCAQHFACSTDKPFLSSNFIYATNSATELIAAISLLDIPNDSVVHGFKTDGKRGVEIKAVTNLMLFKKEIRETEANLKSQLLTVHRVYDTLNPDSEDEIQEYVTNKVYACEVIITNISSRSQKFQVLWQIPKGSIPLGKTSYQKSQPLTLNSYTTTKFNFTFYFPTPGLYTQFPSNIAMGGKVVAKAQEIHLKVINEKDRQVFNQESFEDLLATGT